MMAGSPLERLVEYGPGVDVALGEPVARTLLGLRVVDVVPAPGRGRWTVTPRGKVGAVRVGDVTVRVAPKVPIDRVVFLLDFALHRVAWADRDVGQLRSDDLLHAVAAVFLSAADRALSRGLVQGYRTVEDALPVVRGRIRAEEQLRRRYGLAVPLEVRYDDFTTDTDENRLLRAATERLLRLPGLPKSLLLRLHRLAHRFVEVSALVPGAPLPRWRVTRLNARYEPALRLADVVLSGTSFEHAAGEVPVSGFVIDMPAVFESFVTVSLRRALAPYGGTVHGQHRTYLDDVGLVPIRPDVVWLSDGGRPLVVLDAKYKAERPSGFPEADLYQALAYATALDLSEAHLVYAKGNDAHTSHVVRHAGTRLTAHALNLDRTPADLLQEVNGLAARLAAGTRTEAGRAHGG